MTKSFVGTDVGVLMQIKITINIMYAQIFCIILYAQIFQIYRNQICLLQVCLY